ncbi:MAG: hypothetical protein V1846_02325 [Candidatus Komeilibacteria bacterium]
MKSGIGRRIVLVVGGIIFLTVVVVAVWTGLTQHSRQQTKVIRLELQQIQTALRDYFRDHPGADAAWPAFFVAGQGPKTVWCASQQTEAVVWNLPETIKDYLYQFPVDPSKEVKGVSLYFYQHDDSGRRLGSCTEAADFFLTL